MAEKNRLFHGRSPPPPLVPEHDSEEEFLKEEENNTATNSRSRRKSGLDIYADRLKDRRNAFSKTPKMPTDEEIKTDQRLKQLEHLLNGLSELCASDEPLVDQAYSIALENVSSPEYLKLLADALRKKWLSDPDFPPVAVRICKKLCDLRVEEIRFRSFVYGMIINDYRDRVGLRKISRALFCNSVHFGFEFFRQFHVLEGGYEKLKFLRQRQRRDREETERKKKHLLNQQKKIADSVSMSTTRTGFSVSNQQQQSLRNRNTISEKDDGEDGGSTTATTITTFRQQNPTLPQVASKLGDDDHIYVGFVDPLFDYLQMLIDDMATEKEITLFHYLMFLLGPYLERRKPPKMHTIMMCIRRKVIDSGEMRPSTRASLMELIEIHGHRWKIQSLPSAAVAELYLKYRPAVYDIGVAINETPASNDDEEEDDDDDDVDFEYH